jgi:hypothetical protein
MLDLLLASDLVLVAQNFVLDDWCFRDPNECKIKIKTFNKYYTNYIQLVKDYIKLHCDKNRLSDYVV